MDPPLVLWFDPNQDSWQQNNLPRNTISMDYDYGLITDYSDIWYIWRCTQFASMDLGKTWLIECWWPLLSAAPWWCTQWENLWEYELSRAKPRKPNLFSNAVMLESFGSTSDQRGVGSRRLRQLDLSWGVSSKSWCVILVVSPGLEKGGKFAATFNFLQSHLLAWL